MIGGISNYFVMLIRQFQEFPNLEIKIAAILYKAQKLSIFNTGTSIRFQKRIVAPLAIVVNTLNILCSRFDLIHSTFYARWSIALLSRKPHVVTIHDMIPEDYPELFLGGNPHKYKNKYIKNADGIIVVSTYTYQRLLHFYPEIRCPIAIIPLASEFVLDFDSKVDHRKKFDSRTILFVGPRGGHKNFLLLARSVREVMKILPDVTLLCIGGGEFLDNEKALFVELEISNNINQIDCNDAQLREVYMRSSLLVCPSFAEGFGLPSVEAASMYTPVIVGSNSYLGTKLPSDLILSNITDFQELAKKIVNLLESYTHYFVMAGNCHDSVQDISWKQASIKTYNFYQQVIERSIRVP